MTADRSREQILGRIRKATLASRHGKRGFRHATPRVNGKLTQRFCQQVEASAATLSRCGADELAEHLVAYCRDQDLSGPIAVAPALADLDWSELAVQPGSSDGSHRVAITRALAGIAETGTLVLPSAADRPANLNFLPDVEIVVLQADTLVKRMEDIWKQIPASDMPRVINLITGPSRTADVEQTLQLGAHGPRQLHLVLIEALDG